MYQVVFRVGAFSTSRRGMSAEFFDNDLGFPTLVTNNASNSAFPVL